jgi:hypothetical protein
VTGSYTLTLTAAGSGIADALSNALAGDATDSWTTDSTLPTVTVTATKKLVEGDAGAHSLPFRLSLSEPSSHPVTVELSARSGSATAGEDFRGRDDMVVTFDPGTTNVWVGIPVLGDTAKEGDEWFAVVLSNPAGARLGDAAARATIVDDD